MSVCPSGALYAPGSVDRGKCVLCGVCTKACNAKALSVNGEYMTVDEIAEVAVKDKPFFDESGGGVTVSGGEALLQADFIRELLKRVKELEMRTAVDTAACVPFSRFEKVLPYTDVFLIDIKIFDEVTHRKYTGVSNRPVFENIKRLDERGCAVRIRTPLINGVNCTDDEMLNIAGFVSGMRNIEMVELLAYHSYGEGKYASLNREYHLSGELKPSAEFLGRAEGIFVEKGITTTVQA
jgi:pyruvate formate lyase activating enzyme